VRRASAYGRGAIRRSARRSPHAVRPRHRDAGSAPRSRLCGVLVPVARAVRRGEAERRAGAGGARLGPPERPLAEPGGHRPYRPWVGPGCSGRARGGMRGGQAGARLRPRRRLRARPGLGPRHAGDPALPFLAEGRELVEQVHALKAGRH
jgi:hypothetical protein